MTESTVAPLPALPPTPPPPPVPVPAPVFGPAWPGPGRAAPPTVLAAAFITAIVAAATLGWDRPGVGWLVTGVVAAVAVTVVAYQFRLAEQPAEPGPASTGERAMPEPAMPERVMRVVWALLALGLLASGALRAAEWLWVLCIPAALVCGVLALAGGRSLSAMIQAVVAYPFAVFRALPWAAKGLAAVRGRSGTSGSGSGGSGSNGSGSNGSTTVARVIAAAVVGAVLVLVFGGLLAGADVVFAQVVDDMLPAVDGEDVGRWIWNSVLLFLGTLAACFLALRPPAFDQARRPVVGLDTSASAMKTQSTEDRPSRALNRVEWGIPVGALVVLFGLFVGVQATVLFGGANHVLTTAGLTYAEYARQGFWQLLWVSVLTVLVLAIAARVARRETVADRLWMRVLLGLLAALSLVIVASALSRMVAYEDAYGFSRLRLLVLVCEGWLGLVFLMVLLAGIRLKAPWLARAAAATAAAALVGIVAVNPDHLIAQQNVARYEATGKIDLAYLATLSADAVPALDRLPAELRRCVLTEIDQDLARLGDDALREWNLGRAQARSILADYEPPTGEAGRSCTDRLYLSD
jgi:hypothetical protein